MHFKTVFISDLHLGAKKSKANELYQFLKENTFDEIFLVGDVIDIWRFKQAFSLSKDQKDVHMKCITRLLRLASKGTMIHYIIGNHDLLMEKFILKNLFTNIEITEKSHYIDSLGKSWQVIHGHQYDLVTKYAIGERLGLIGDHIYDFLIFVNEWYNKARNLFGFEYRSISKYIKVKFKKAAMFLDNFHMITVDKAHEEGYDGVITGHIHDPQLDKEYANCGCWTDLTNLSFLVDNGSGLELWKYDPEKHCCNKENTWISLKRW